MWVHCWGLIQIAQIGARRGIFGLMPPRRAGAQEQMCKRNGRPLSHQSPGEADAELSFKVKDRSGLY